MPKTTFVDGNPALGIQGTIVTADWLNAISNHRHDGKDLDGHGVLDYAVSTGSAGAYEITLSPALEEYIPGMPVYVKVHQDSIGGDTLEIASLDALPIRRADRPLAAGEIVAGQMCVFIYNDDIGDPSFQLVSAPSSRGINTDITVTVGAGGDYATINDALAYLSQYYPLYVKSGFTAEIKLLSGFVMAEQVLVRSIDLAWITITSEDAEVVIDRSALTENMGAVVGSYPAFGVTCGAGPSIGALFVMDTRGPGLYRDGIYAEVGASLYVLSGCGVKNAGHNGLSCTMVSTVQADGAIFSGSSGCGVRVSRMGRVSFDGGIATGCGEFGLYALRGGYMNAIYANAQKGPEPSPTDIMVTEGSIIQAKNATGGLCMAPNTITLMGIIFQ